MRSLKTLLFITILVLFYSPARADYVGDRVLKIVIDGDINPVTAEYIASNIERAYKNDYQCLLIQMDTPGGLLQSTKIIVRDILTAKVPVVMYISPSGSGAVSAGVFITMACHIAAMDKGTNIGAAHPVGVGGQQDTSAVMGEKITNYSVSWIRGIAEKRGRNADWAETAVRESKSINEDEALQIHVIDYIADSEQELLSMIDGKTIDLEDGEQRTLHTRDAVVITHEMTWRHKVLNRISNPNIAYILLMLGIYGIFFELSNPGSILPGVLGGIFIVLAFFALQTLPVRSAGILLILFAVLLFILEIKVPSYGILTIGGIVSMFLGSLMLFNSAPGFPVQIDWKLGATVSLASAAFFVFALGKAIQIRMTKPTTGREGLIGTMGIALTAVHNDGSVRVHGEIWQAESDQPVKKGSKIKVIAVNGLLLKIENMKQ